MANIKQIGMAAGTFSVALGIGFVMQNGDALASRFGAETGQQEVAPFTNVDTASQETEAGVTAIAADGTPIETAQAGVVALQTPSIESPSDAARAAVILPETAKVPARQDPPVQLANLDPDDSVEVDSDTILESEMSCAPQMTATASVAATVAVSVIAPCYTETAFTVHHQGMMFTAVTDIDGIADLSVPALAEVAVVIAAFDEGEGSVATVVIPDFASYDRAVLQWQGDTSVMLSAYEGGADFGDSGHIYVDNPGDVSRVSNAEGGYLQRLGDSTIEDALIAEVYTFPTGMMNGESDVMLVAEAEITGANCGQELSAQSIQISPTGQPSALDLRMVMPECDAVGDFLILQNMFEDLTIAMR
ncbi:hypothetical protein Q4555_09860 [Octadecabacter sp. 1_MG-2023]|uniref:hypothetical protein n=1 Tax=unclassified Octadecabacter TaxID=196158 RepID=UPI001C086A37|nr:MULTISPECIES: hypothetical protein [unclassified Octadecabacter]MBU2992265.1 hypothetical protein [Octadecabacter sp. B2R22]MDO6734979.1 hypothetical protein [Octadecabacter sp. 1_MG-2023]